MRLTMKLCPPVMICVIIVIAYLIDDKLPIYKDDLTEQLTIREYFNPLMIISWFEHADIGHLLANLMVLIVTSIPISLILPVWVQPLTFVLSCWTGTVAHLVMLRFKHLSTVTLCGSSGGVHGLWVVGIYSIIAMRQRSKNLFDKTNYYTGDGQLFLNVIAMSWVAFLLLGFYIASLAPDISMASHLGGSMGGLIVILCLMCHYRGLTDEVQYNCKKNMQTRHFPSSRDDFFINPAFDYANIV